MLVCIILCSCKSKEHKNEQLSTTIDSTLQVKATSILENKLSELNALSVQAIVMEVQTGHIKAMVELERKDSADYQPCENFSQAHESALIQPISILAALETGEVKLSDKVDTGEGIYQVHDRELKDHNWHRGGYGEISIKQGLASSSNIAIYLKSATKLFSVLLASKRPLITELADKLRLKYPLLPTISPCPTMRLEAIRSIIPISCRRYPKSV